MISPRLRSILLISLLALAAQPGAARTAKPPLHGRHWMAITGKPLAATAGRDDVPEGRQRRGRGLRHARRRLHHVGHARLGRRDPGADLQPARPRR